MTLKEHKHGMGSRKLSNYRAKRDFTRTSEPSGAVDVAPAEHLRFVIQKHAARRPHYDLRLELDGVFKSWAVTRGPSLDPAEKRLAVEVEDHPLEYGDFEGTIPAGEYGGGTVQLWDRGFWAPEGKQRPQAALESGELKFVLEGERLHGSWVLVRMKGDRLRGNRTNWLLIKHRDQDARTGDQDRLLAQDRSVASGRSLAEITSGKGRAPKPFMAKDTATKANAVWNSNRGRPEGTQAASDTTRGRLDAAQVISGSPQASRRASAARPRAKIPATSSRADRTAKGAQAAIPAFVEPQLAMLFERPPAASGWGHEIKLDGYRMQLRVENGQAVLKTRKGLDWTEKFGSIAAAARTLPDCIMDGEVVAPGPNGWPDFSALQAALSDGDDDALLFFVFDLMFAEGEDLRRLPLMSRKRRLKELLDAQPKSTARHIRYLDHAEASGEAILEAARDASLEGIVSKQLDAPYRSGRTGSWIKVKCRAGHEVVIGGWTSRGQGQDLSSLIVGVYKDGRLVPVGRVGTGFSGEKVRALSARLKTVATDKSPFAERVQLPGDRRIHWVKPELVAEIELAGWTDGGNVRQAAFRGLRDDKPASEVHAEMPMSAGATDSKPKSGTPERRQARSADKNPATSVIHGENRRSAKSRTAEGANLSTSNGVMGVAISKPDKIFWPDAGDGRPVTKLDLARYYEAVSAWLMPHIKGRPCSILRAPDGLEGETFFQRHAMSGMSKLFDLMHVSGDRESYVAINRAEALAAVAQSGGIELHPWNCEPGHPDVPGRLVFDLDPSPDVDFGAVITAALEMRERLAAIGLESFCKTTGGKGLHVVTPLEHPRQTKLDWPLVKAFAREVCRQMAADSPNRYLINMSKSARKGLIFLDYLRNDRLSTAVAPLSPRVRPGAAVSMPITWEQVRPGLDPSRFTLRTAPALMARSRAWQGYQEAARPVVRAIELLSNRRPADASAKASALQEKGDGRAPAEPQNRQRRARSRKRERATGRQGSAARRATASRGKGAAGSRKTTGARKPPPGRKATSRRGTRGRNNQSVRL